MEPPPPSDPTDPGPAGPGQQAPDPRPGPGALRRFLATAGKVAAVALPYAIALGIEAAGARWADRARARPVDRPAPEPETPPGAVTIDDGPRPGETIIDADFEVKP